MNISLKNLDENNVIDLPQTDLMPSKYKKPEIDNNYLGRIATPEDMAGTTDFNDPNSQKSQDTASLLASMRANREYNLESSRTPLSERMFNIIEAKESAREQAKNYLEERKLKLQEDTLKLKMLDDVNKQAKDENKFISESILKSNVDTNNPIQVEQARNYLRKLYNGESIADVSKPIDNSNKSQPDMGVEIPGAPTVSSESKEPFKLQFQKEDKRQESADRAASRQIAFNLADNFQKSPLYKKFEEAQDFKLKTDMINEELAKGDFANLAMVDLTLGYLFNKLNDPNSVVREGEFDRTFKGQPLINKIKGKFAQIAEGGMGLDDETRKELIKMIPLLFKSTSKAIKQKYDKILKPRIDEFNKQGYTDVNERSVMGDFADILNIEDNNSETKSKISAKDYIKSLGL